MGRSQGCRKGFIYLGAFCIGLFDNRFGRLGVVHRSLHSLLLKFRLDRTVHA